MAVQPSRLGIPEMRYLILALLREVGVRPVRNSENLALGCRANDIIHHFFIVK